MMVPTWKRMGVAVLAFVLSIVVAGTVGYLLAGWLP
jgi:hypothetical protein